MTVSFLRRAVLALAGALVLAPTAWAAPTGLVPSGPPVWSNDPSYTVSQQGNVFGITVIPLDPAIAQRGWSGSWSCPPGTELAAVDFSALRYHSASAAGLEVQADGRTVWQVADADIPRNPPAAAPGKAYEVLLPPGTCSATLRLYQRVQEAQGQRAWTIYNPVALIRDLQPPSVQIDALTPGWVRTNQAALSFSATDNLGAQGIGQARVLVAGQPAWSGSPGQCAPCPPVALDLSRVGDGPAVPVQLQLDGTATQGAEATGTLSIDRTPPVAAIAALKTGPSAAVVPIGVADTPGASGLAGWVVYANQLGGPLVATSAAPQALSAVDLSQLAAPGDTLRFVLVATDVAGNAALAVSNPITRDPLTQSAGAQSQLPDLSGVRSAGLTSPQARRQLRADGHRVPVVVVDVGTRVSVLGRFVHANGRGLAGASVRLVDPSGSIISATLADRGGRYRLRFTPERSGTWSLEALGRPSVPSPLVVRLRPILRLERLPRAVRAGSTLTVRGTLSPRRAGGHKIVQLQVHLHGRWPALDQARADAAGRFRLRYPLLPGARFAIELRVAVPQDRDWPFAATLSRPFTVRVGG